MSMYGSRNELTVSYSVPDSGIYEHDLFASELAGPKARETSFGTYYFPMFRRTFSYAFEEKNDLQEAKARFEAAGIFRVFTNGDE